MTLDRLRPVAGRLLEPTVALANRAGLTPNAVSAISLLVAIGAGACLYLGGEARSFYVGGALLVALNGWLDLLDGALAREQGAASRAGDLLDHVIDRYADIVIVAGLAAGVSRYALGFAAVTGVLMTSYLGTQTQAIDLDRTYGGLVGRADRLVLVGIAAVLAAAAPGEVYGLTPVGWLLVLFAVVGHLTAIQRFTGAWRDLT